MASRNLIARVFEKTVHHEKFYRSGSKITSLGCVAARMKHTLPDLPYDYNALEPYVSADIMKLHHSKHHATYVNNLNVAEEKLSEAQAKGKLQNNLLLLLSNFQCKIFLLITC